MYDIDEEFESESAAREAEAREQQILLGRGFEFVVGKRKYTIRQPYLGTLDHLAEQFLKLDLNKEKLQSEDPMEIFGEQKRLVRPNASILARIVAIAALNSFWKIKLLVPIYTLYFRWNITPEDLMKLTGIVIRASNLQDFTASIALLSVNRTTAPKAIEG